MVSDDAPSNYERRKNGKIRKEEKKRFFKNLELAIEGLTGRKEQISEDPAGLIKGSIQALFNLKKDLARSGYVVFKSDIDVNVEGRHFRRVVQKHLEPIFQALPELPLADFADPSQYQTIAGNIEEQFDRDWEFGISWSPDQEIVGNLVIPILQSLSDFYRRSLPEEKTGLCIICFRMKKSGSEYCFLHTRAECNKICNENRKGNRARYAEARRKKPSKEFLRAKVFSHGKFRLSIQDERILSDNIVQSWSSTKERLADRLKNEAPHVFKRIQTAFSASDWETAVQEMAVGLGDDPPPPCPVSGVFFWLIAAEAYFSSGFEKISKADQIREMLGQGMKQSDLTRSVGVSRQLVNRIAREKREDNVLQVSLQKRG